MYGKILFIKEIQWEKEKKFVNSGKSKKDEQG